ncbi:MAG: M2 family metallopeptidase [Bacteroidetes bacterium]|nr:M2 family metallopeptidase [Bacteroidota bacterium]
MKQLLILSLAALIGFTSCKSKEADADVQRQAQAFLDGYNKEYQRLTYADNLGQWQLNTHIVEGDTMDQHNAAIATAALAAYTGSAANIDSARKYLKEKSQLTPLQVRELNTILFLAGNNPATAGEVVKKRIDLTNDLVARLYGYTFKMNGAEVTPNKIDEILRHSSDLNERLAAWQSAKEVGKGLKDGLAEVRDLRNASVTPLDYKDFFAYNASDYGMSTEEMTALTHSMIRDVWPLYRELHTWARYTLAEKYHQSVPEYIPAHWLPNRWGQDWSELVDVKGLNIDGYLKGKGAEWIPRESERFYMSIGFDSLPPVFWEKSSLYPVAANAGYKKNTHASAWHMDLADDIRSLQSIEANTEWWATCLHEFGHIYYYRCYSNPSVPILLRNGANRGYHEAFGTMMGLASLQKPFLQGLGMVDAHVTTNDTLQLLRQGLQYIVNIPWGSGTMTEFEHALYSEKLPKDQFNAKWWELVKKCQGIVPPTERGEEYCDAATKTHIIDDPAQYYDYSIANVLLFQFHAYIAEHILHQDPHATNYWGNKDVGAFLKQVMAPGQSVDWREHLQATIHSDMSAKPMVEYFAPLMAWLKEQNKGRKYTLPEQAPY